VVVGPAQGASDILGLQTHDEMAGYQLLVDDLREEGYDAHFVDPGRERPGVEVQADVIVPPEVAQAAADFAIHVGRHLEDYAIGAIVAAAVKRLRPKAKRPLNGVIYDRTARNSGASSWRPPATSRRYRRDLVVASGPPHFSPLTP
jgi:hypothetical protein